MSALNTDEATEPRLRPALSICRHPDLELVADEKLVSLMADKTNEALGLRACDELHARHAHFLLAFCYKYKFETFGDSAEHFVNETFYRAFIKACQFPCPKIQDAEIRSDAVVAWLFTILRNAFYDAYEAEGRKRLVRSLDGTDEWLESEMEKRRETAIVPRVPDAWKNAVLTVREQSSPVDRAILDTMGEYWSPVTGETEIEPEVRANICAQFELTENSLRVRRNRLKAKIRDLASKHNNTNTNTTIESANEKPSESR
jgi:DNA-directed RNA polymerase specialized sigma24 family protein